MKAAQPRKPGPQMVKVAKGNKKRTFEQTNLKMDEMDDQGLSLQQKLERVLQFMKLRSKD